MLPLEMPVHQVPPSLYRPVMSALPSPLRPATSTSSQVAPVLQVVEREVLKDVLPLDRPVHHDPPCKYRPVMSALPSPLKSPTLTSTQVAAVLHVAHRLLVKVLPVDCPIHHCPLSRARPTMSIFPSPLKSPTLTSTQVTAVLHVSHKLLVKPPNPLD